MILGGASNSSSRLAALNLQKVYFSLAKRFYLYIHENMDLALNYEIYGLSQGLFKEISIPGVGRNYPLCH
jgi:hypothetical protein